MSYSVAVQVCDYAWDDCDVSISSDLDVTLGQQPHLLKYNKMASLEDLKNVLRETLE